MITVKYKPDSNCLTIKGHAGYAEPGKDIICASASMIFYNLCAMLRQYPAEAFSMPLEMKMAKGKRGVTSVKCKPSAAYETWIDHDFLYALTGFQTLAGNYPEYVNLVVTQK